MSNNIPNTIFTELTKAGVLFSVLGLAVYYLYSDNRRYQENIEKRLFQVELQVNECMKENNEILRNEVNKGHIVIEKNNKILEKIIIENNRRR